MTTTVDLLIDGAAQVITCASATTPGPLRGHAMQDVGIIVNGAVAVQDGVIVAVGASDDLKAQYRPRRQINAAGRIVCPGFVDSHTHLVYAGDRINEFEMRIQGASYQAIMKTGGGIRATVQATRAATLDELVHTASFRLNTMLQAGTTTAEVKSGYGLDTETEIRMLRAMEELDQRHAIDLVPTFLGAHVVAPEFDQDHDAYVDLIIAEMLPAVRAWYHDSSFAARGIPLFNDVFCEDGAFDLDQTRRLLTTGIHQGMRPKLHADEFTSLGGVSLAVELGAASVDHLDVTGAAEMDELAGSQTVGVVLPVVPFHLGKCQYADARGLIDKGAAVALATDANPGSAPCLSMPLVMAIACRYQGLTPAEALIASTLNGAYAVGLGQRIGSIEPGKAADLLVVNAPDYRHLAYRLGENLVGLVIKHGQPIPISGQQWAED